MKNLLQTRQLPWQEGLRTWHYYVPPYANFERRVPVVIFLHGAGGSGPWADGETGWSLLAQRQGFAVVLPDGSPIHPNKPAKFLTNPLIWNDGSGAWGERQRSLDDIDFLSALLDELPRQLPIDPQRVFLTGFSNGAGMTFRFAASAADRLTAIAPVAGIWWTPLEQPRCPIPTFFLCGDVDPLIPYAGGRVRNPWGLIIDKPSVPETVEAWARAIGWTGTAVEVLTSAEHVRWQRYPTSSGVEMQFALIEGLGHHWPGGKGQLSHKIAGPASHRLHATDAIWQFFHQQAHRVV